MTGWDLLKALRRYAVSIIALTLIGTLAMLGYVLKNKGDTTEYLAYASTRITQSDTMETSDPRVPQASIEAERRLEVPFYTSDPVLNQAIETTGVDIEVRELSKNVVIVVPDFSFKTVIYVKQADEENALALADAIAEAGVQAISQEREEDSIYTTTVSQTARADAVDSGFSMKTLEENNGKNVTIATASTSPKKKLVGGFILGLLLGIAQAILRWLLDKRVCNFDDLKDTTDSFIIGATSKENTTAELQAHSTVKFLRSSLLAENQDNKKTVVLTSPRLTDDTLSISQALVESLRSSGQKALLIDTQNASNINIQSITTDNWQQQADNAEYMWGTETNASATADFLASQKCAELLDAISDDDVIPVVSAPGLLENTAALMPMSKAHTVLLVSSGVTTATEIRDSEKALANMNKKIDGIIMTNISQSLQWKLRYGYETAQAAA